MGWLTGPLVEATALSRSDDVVALLPDEAVDTPDAIDHTSQHVVEWLHQSGLVVEERDGWLIARSTAPLTHRRLRHDRIALARGLARMRAPDFGIEDAIEFARSGPLNADPRLADFCFRAGNAIPKPFPIYYLPLFRFLACVDSSDRRAMTHPEGIEVKRLAPEAIQELHRAVEGWEIFSTAPPRTKLGLDARFFLEIKRANSFAAIAIAGEPIEDSVNAQEIESLAWQAFDQTQPLDGESKRSSPSNIDRMLIGEAIKLFGYVGSGSARAQLFGQVSSFLDDRPRKFEDFPAAVRKAFDDALLAIKKNDPRTSGGTP